jgi:hypothetical protein
MKKKVKTYYIGLNLTNNEVIIATTKTNVAKFLKISVDTLDRKLKTTPYYIGDKYSIWSGIEITYAMMGWRRLC